MTSALAIDNIRALPQALTWAQREEIGSRLIKTGFLPEAIKTPAQAVAIMLKGEELGIPRMYALSNIHVIKGKPTCSAELMLTLIRRDHGSRAIRVKYTDNQKCTVQWRTPGWDDDISEYTWTIEDARAAGVAVGDNWKKYPAAMLRARTISAVARMAFPESIAGMYTPDEIGGQVTVTESGDVEYEETGQEAIFAETRVIETPNGTVDGETGQIIDAPDPRKQKLIAALHAHAASEMLFPDTADKHDALHDIVLVSFGHGSMKDCNVASLTTLMDWLKQQTPLESQIKLDYFRSIIDASEMADLDAVAKELKEAGISDELLRTAWRNRLKSLTPLPKMTPVTP